MHQRGHEEAYGINWDPVIECRSARSGDAAGEAAVADDGDYVDDNLKPDKGFYL